MFSITQFSSRLKEPRIAIGMTQKEIASELGIIQPAYNRFERGKYQLNYEQLFYVCNRFGVSADYLLGLEDETGAKIYQSGQYVIKQDQSK